MIRFAFRAALLYSVMMPFQGAFSQTLSAVRAEPGLKCMSLDAEALAATRQQDLPPVLSAPEPNAQRIGYPGSIVFVTVPLQERNGYVAMVRLNGQRGWMEASHLKPWHPPNGGNAQCTPLLMSNGLLGTSIR